MNKSCGGGPKGLDVMAATTGESLSVKDRSEFDSSELAEMTQVSSHSSLFAIDVTKVTIAEDSTLVECISFLIILAVGVAVTGIQEPPGEHVQVTVGISGSSVMNEVMLKVSNGRRSWGWSSLQSGSG